MSAGTIILQVLLKAKLAKGSIHEKIRDVTGSLVETDAEGEFTYEQTNKVIGYLNSRNLNGGNQWRLPTIAELAALRQCANGWDKMGEKIEIPNGNSTISVPLKCAEAQNSIFNVFNIVAPVPVGESGGLGVWTSTLAGKDEYGTSKIWTVSSIFGQIGIVDGKNSVDDGVYQNIFLVRDK
ncbi:MAG: DUF1566 domain-containing protein [Acinetobacter sp.]|nr:DUF1566 domain-containing protein [Acinetobacter sp.]